MGCNHRPSPEARALFVVVPSQGIEPRSLRYQRNALPLSYDGKFGGGGGIEAASKIRLHTTSTLIVTYYYCSKQTIRRVTRIITDLNLINRPPTSWRYPYLGLASLSPRPV